MKTITLLLTLRVLLNLRIDKDFLVYMNIYVYLVRVSHYSATFLKTSSLLAELLLENLNCKDKVSIKLKFPRLNFKTVRLDACDQ